MSGETVGKVAILGAGGMGTAMAVLWARSARAVGLWSRDPQQAQDLAETRRNERYLPGVRLPAAVRPTADPSEAVRDADLIVAAIPSEYLRATLSRIADVFPPDVPVLSVIKGIEAGTFAPPSRVIRDVLSDRPIAVLSGPGHAEELAAGLPASLVVAGEDGELNRNVQTALNREMIRIYTNPDAKGVELAGALKNVLGIAAGICEGLGLGDNARAALLTRGLAEITRYAVALGAEPSTFWGLAGVGDLLTTCYSPHGRNRGVGLRIGRGETLNEILAGMRSVAEGVVTSRNVDAHAQALGIEMPITREVSRILHQNKPPRTALQDLMVRAPKVEWSFEDSGVGP